MIISKNKKSNGLLYIKNLIRQACSNGDASEINHNYNCIPFRSLNYTLWAKIALENNEN